MARVAVTRATRVQDARIVLGNVVWERPFVVEEGQSAGLHVGLSRQPDGSIAFRIYSDAALHSHGRAQIAAPPPAATLDLSVLQARMTRARFSAEQCYAAFATLGIAYGPAHRGLQTVYAGSGEALARLDLPATADAFVLPPGLVDSALQASLALLLDAGGALAAPTAMLPFALARVEILAPCAAAVWAWVAASGDSHAGEQMQKLDITLCDADGQVCARLLGFAARRLTTAQGLAPAADSSTDAALKERTGRYLKGLLAKATRLAAERIAVDTPLEEYGLDSVMVIKLTSELEKTFGALSKTLFFEHKHLDELADYFVTAHAGRLRTLFGAPDSAAVAAAAGVCRSAVDRRRAYRPSGLFRRGSRCGHHRSVGGAIRWPPAWSNSGPTCATASIASPRFRPSAGITAGTTTRTGAGRGRPTANGAASWTASISSIRSSSTSRRATPRSSTRRNACSSKGPTMPSKTPATPATA
jgi:acyl carrier protein